MRCKEYADFKIVQFNDLPFNGTIENWSYDNSFRIQNTPYVFKHGDYVPNESPYLESFNVTLSIQFDMDKLRKGEERQFIDFATENFSTGGILWATYGNELLYTNAIPSSIGRSKQPHKRILTRTLDFFCKDGYWHKADNHATFLTEYQQCDFSLCRKYMDYKLCFNTNSTADCGCGCGNPYGVDNGVCVTCRCDCNLDMNDSLCNIQMQNNNLYKDLCKNVYKIHADCYRGKELFGNDFYGEKFCKEDGKTVIGGTFFSSSSLDAGFTMTLIGNYHSPTITINNTVIQIDGEVDGMLQVSGNKASFYTNIDGEYIHCGDKIVKTTNIYPVKPQLNTFLVTCVDNSCKTACVYIKTHDITI